MTRASDDDVRAVIDHKETLPKVSMQPYIHAATGLVGKIASNDSNSLLSSDDLKQVEIFLAAHFYAHKDLQFKESSAGRSEAVYQTGKDGLGPLEMTMWGRSAMLLDVTGYLTELNQDAVQGKRKVTIQWLGKPPSTQDDYVDRD